MFPSKLSQTLVFGQLTGYQWFICPGIFFVNNHLAVEDALGEKVYGQQLYTAGYKSAWEWCASESVTHHLTGLEVFYHYMNRISQRGWGQFTVMSLDANNGSSDIRLEHSIFVEHCGSDAGRNLCYMYSGWFAGSLEWVGQTTDRCYSLNSKEALCASNGAKHCLFKVRPI